MRDMYHVVETKRYRKDFKRMRRSGYNTEKLTTIVDRIAAGEDLPDRHRVHSLKGDYTGMEECHIQSDWLLVYKREKKELVLLLMRTGTHADLFGE